MTLNFIDNIVMDVIIFGYFSSVLFIIVGVLREEKRILICFGILILMVIYLL